MENKNIILLKKRSRQTFAEQCTTYEDFVRFDVTSCNRDNTVVQDLSPLYIGPVVSSDGIVATTFENLWQYGKVYPRIYDANKKIVAGIDAEGNPTPNFWDWRRRFYETKHVKGDRHPAFPASVRHRDCRYTVYFEKDENGVQQLKKLGYVESRKKIYIPEYAKLVVGTNTFKRLKKMVEEGTKLALCDFDAWNYYGPNLDQNVTIKDVVNNPAYKVGHGYVLKMLLQGDIEVIDGKVIDHIGVLS
ncbi:MAG: hypothetical protein K5765_01775 [Clostridia bacterium]|nr:hypothetical protein [Clostridia bacterium]